ncbi:uncharacterized protein C8A04DRAFT_11409 [Dichotomopilus funicola]|uniref:F-box domain-containing protein n=1 Tax=Dichotomopilus funicola TaxID=1934379 RepID=A0AAN6V415_9PEZI|nr:hypothetical protein C8A04DRAFT_11409 [Dichotomopilus funicola]
MPLLQLPPEILLHILRYLGSQFFAHDTRRLTISRGWYHLAWTVFLRDVRLTPESLETFTQNDLILQRSSPHMVSVDISLPLRPKRDLSPSPPADDDEIDGPFLHLDSSLAKFATILPGCSGIRSLNIHTHVYISPEHFGNVASLNALRVTNLLSPPHLTSLDLDTAACRLESQPDSNVHVCNVISALLPSLRRLRCRMEHICEEILQLPSAGSATLEEVIINMSIFRYHDDDIIASRFSKSCGAAVRAVTSLRIALETQAVTLAARIPNPRMVRIISHKGPFLEVYAFDAITKTRLQLENNLEWDADGELLDEGNETEDSESDLFADDSPIEPVFNPYS